MLIRKINAKLVYGIGLFLNVLTLVCLKYTGAKIDLSIFQFIFYRTLISTILLTPHCGKMVTKIGKKDWPLCIFAAFCAGYDAYVYNLCYSKIPVNNVSIIMFLSPMLITFFAWVILKERISKNLIFALLIGIIGVLSSFNFQFNNFNAWYLLLFSDLIISSIGFVVIKILAKYYSASLILYVRLILMLPVALILALHQNPINFNTMIIIFFITIGYISERYLLTKAYTMSDISSLQPVRFLNLIFTPTLGYFILGEKILPNQVFAFICVALAIYIANSNVRIKFKLR